MLIEEDTSFLICDSCGTRYLESNIRTYDGVGYFCHKCKRYVALNFKDEIVTIDTVLDVNWNEKIKDRATEINESLYIVNGSDLKDNLVLKALQIQSQAENSFHETDPDEQPFLLLFDSEKYLGFIVWERDSELNADILQQIFIVDSERKKGYGTKFLKYWVVNYAKKVRDLPHELMDYSDIFLGKFGIEISRDSPLWGVLINLGYAERRNVPVNFFTT